MEASVLHVLKYYEVFLYPPTLEEIHLFCQKKASRQQIQDALHKLIFTKKVFNKDQRFALKMEQITRFEKKKAHSKELLRSFFVLLPFYSWIPTLSYIGLSGSLSMYDADLQDDIDLFVIVMPHSIWITRLIVLSITRILSLFHNSTARRLCWNIFIEERGLLLPPQKRNEYTAHEILQMKTVLNRRKMYEEFVSSNDWLTKILPNVQIKFTKMNKNYRLSGKLKVIKWIDRNLKNLQISWLHKKGYTVTEYGYQMWFIQDDFEKKIPLKLKKVDH